jgi:hypothetical protein
VLLEALASGMTARFVASGVKHCGKQAGSKNKLYSTGCFDAVYAVTATTKQHHDMWLAAVKHQQ